MVPWDVERRMQVATFDDDPRLVANVVGRRVSALPVLRPPGVVRVASDEPR